MGKFRDLTGERFGYLTVIKRAEDYVSPSGSCKVQWSCECDCGKTNHIALGSNLTKNLVKSCGCMMKNPSIIFHRKHNTYDLSGDYGIGYTIKGERFYFDLEDYDKIKDYYWYKSDSGYVLAGLKKINGKQKTIRMHNLLMGEFGIDHINNNKSDNRRFNLRKATVSQNSINRAVRKNNVSGVTGVYWSKQRNKWFAKIVLNNKQIHLGFFDDFNDAVKARKEGEDKYFGEYSYDNSQSYNIN